MFVVAAIYLLEDAPSIRDSPCIGISYNDGIGYIAALLGAMPATTLACCGRWFTPAYGG